MGTLTFADFDFAPEPEQIEQIYRSGFVGAIAPDRTTRLMAAARSPTFYEVLPAARGISKQIELALPIRASQALFGQDYLASRDEDQEQGDCVGKMLRLQGMLEASIDVMFGLEEWKYDAAGKALWYCCENHYGDRGHGGEGANCDRLWDNATTRGRQGFLHRGRYGNVDLTRYNARASGSWGGRGTPAEVTAAASPNRARSTVRPDSMEAVRDALALGFAIGRCGNDGYASTRDANGVSDVSGTWNHAITVFGYAATKLYQDQYGGSVYLHGHNWAEWNRGPTPFEIPKGSWFVRERFLQKWVRNKGARVLMDIPGIPKGKDDQRDFVADRIRHLRERSLLCLSSTVFTPTREGSVMPSPFSPSSSLPESQLGMGME